jgi:hypothetical protein
MFIYPEISSTNASLFNLHLFDNLLYIQADKKIEEAIKWGNLTFVKNGKNIAFVYTYDKAPYINFGFLKATSLKDPKGFFQGTGKGIRHVKIYSEKDIDKKQFAAWVEEAVQLEEVDR